MSSAPAQPLFDGRRWDEFRSALRSAATQALRKLDSDPGVHIAAGARALDRREYPLAAKCFRWALQRDPEHYGALYGLSEALVSAREYEQAVGVYERILRLAPEDAVSRFNLAVVESRLRRFDRAAEIYRRLLNDDEDHVQARYNLATLYQLQGKLAAARDTWNEVIARAPHLPSAHTALGEVLTDLGDRQGAMQAYAQAAKLRPKEVSAWANFAAAAQGAGSYGRALAAIRNALNLAPLNADLWAQQGEIQLDLHRRTGEGKFLQAAIASWRKGLQLDPARTEIREWLRTYDPRSPGAASRPVR